VREDLRDYETIAADDCPVCGKIATVVHTDCTEGHGDDCPDRLCISCGTALFIDPNVNPARRTAGRTA
jgi:hypothetical protein